VSPEPLPDAALRLRRLWEEHRKAPFPGSTDDPRLQEVALYQSWLGSVVEAALAGGGRLSAKHRSMLAVREREGDRALWVAAADLGEPVRSHVARLLAIQAALVALPER
jgi:hypothetical protein